MSLAYDPTAALVAGLFVILSGIIRAGGVAAHWRTVELGMADAGTLSALTGVRPDRLAGVFGPPTLGGIFHVSAADVRRRRGWQGVLLSESWLDTASIALAAAALITGWPWLREALWLALAQQVLGWGAVGLLRSR